MKFIFAGKNIDVTNAIKEYTEKKIGRLEKFFNEDTEIHATFSVEKTRHIVDVNIVYNGNVYRAEEVNEDLYTSIDKVIDVLEAQVKKNKTRNEDRKKDIAHDGGFVSDADFETGEKEIVKVKKYSIKPMAIEDAVLAIEEKGSAFMAFNNSKTNKVNVIYRLKDGNFGLVEPEQ